MELQGQRFFVGLLLPCGNHNESRPCPMLTLACIDALLVNEELIDLVGEALDSGEINSQRAHTAWLLIALGQEDF